MFETSLGFFVAIGFGLIYGATLLGVSATYCHQLESAFHPTECEEAFVGALSENNNTFTNETQTDSVEDVDLPLDIFCERHTTWRSCSIAGIVVGSIIFIFTLVILWYEYPPCSYQRLEEETYYTSDAWYTPYLMFVLIISAILTITVFSVLVQSKPDQGPVELRSAAFANIVLLGVGVGLVVLACMIIVCAPIFEWFSDFLGSI